MNLSYVSQFASTILKTACALALLMGPVQGMAQEEKSVEQSRKDMIQETLTHDNAGSIEDGRGVCANGDEPDMIRKQRAKGSTFLPDPSDDCIAVLTRTARDGNLLKLYADMVQENGGNMDGYEKLPDVIGGAVLHDKTEAAIGNYKAIIVKPALAFDAGFTVAYRSAANKVTKDTQKLKALVEDCLDQKRDAGSCFAVGYTVGSNVYQAQVGVK